MADITPGYTFTAGETNVDDVKLNTAAAGTINTTFYSGKSAVAANPSTSANYGLVFDSGSSTFKKGTLAALYFDHTGLLSGRTVKAGVPLIADTVLIADSAASGAYKQLTLGNMLFGAVEHTTPVQGDIIPIYDRVGDHLRTITIDDLIHLLATHSSPVGGDEFMVREAGGNPRKITMATLLAYFRPDYVLLRDEKAITTDGGTFNSGAWQTRTLNTESSDNANLSVLAANQVTLNAGTYRFRGCAPGYQVAQHQCRLRNVTDGTTIATGSSETSGAASAAQTTSIVTGRFTIAGSKALELQHQCASSQATNGFGLHGGFGTEVYATLEFWREQT